MLEFEGDGFPDAERKALEAFCLQLEGHPHGGRVDGRIVLAEDRPEGMIQALQMYMDAQEFEGWNARRKGRTGVTGGKTFVADDNVVTAVLAPLPGQELLDLAAHEAIEIAHAVKQKEDGFIRPENPDEADGLTLFDEYCVERVRRAISDELSWPEGQMDGVLGLRPAAEEIASRMPSGRLHPPGFDFLRAWLEMARQWVMACGRADGGSESARRDIAQWREHGLIADEGWRAVQRSLGELFAQPELGFTELAPFTASLIRRPIIVYGRDAWRQ
jgi:hypothetical protein